uniref:Zinc finger CCCH domain-containing protein 14 n=1 Tax=Homalodisca liturata TaxID=320908 RepID=A0A1B6H900_9HEMI
MEGIGAEVTQKIRSAIKAKLMEIGVYVDEELPDYVMVMVVNKRSKADMDDELALFLGKHTSLFTSWLHQVLQKLQEVTVANLGPGGIKRKLSDDYKKKKKSKQDHEKKEIKKRIKIEPVDDENKEIQRSKETEKEKKKMINMDESENIPKNTETVGQKRKEKAVSGRTVNETKSISRQNERRESMETSHKQDEEHRVMRSKSHSISSQVGDLDDDDCINIRTDGELLDTAEEINTEDVSRKTKDHSLNSKISENDFDKKRTNIRRSPHRQNEKFRSEDLSAERPSEKETVKRQRSPTESPPKSNDKLVDARELLNRKKAAKLSDNRTRSRSRERSWSTSPPRRRRDYDRDNQRYRDDRDNRRVTREEEREHTTRRVGREDRRERKCTRERDTYSTKRRGDNRTSRRDLDSRDNRKRDSSGEPPSNRITLEKPFRNKVNEWESSRSSKVNNLSESRKVGMDSPVKRRDLEESSKRSGLVSHVVARPQEPEDSVDTPVPSVVKITPRPRRPPSQQASSNLIIKAISEANKSLANIPQRPDSTQRTRKEPVFTRTLRQSKRIPPEKIAISITNPLALQTADSSEIIYESDDPSLPKNDEIISNRSNTNNIEIIPTSPEPEESAQNKAIPTEEKEKDEPKSAEQLEEPEIELEISTELEPFEEEMEEMSDPQFVVTLNGYDPDGLFSQSGEEGDDEWLKETVDEEPLLTSTPDHMPSPKRNSSPIVFKNNPNVNHSNLIEVEVVKTMSTERCKYWPACRMIEKCPFYHPTKPCKIFPACKFGDACLYIHPQCKYNALCTRKDCVFAHTPAHTPMQPAAAPKAKAIYAAAAPLPCKYYPNCTNINCQFAHPPRACRFGLYCTKKDCSFEHGQVAPVDKLKWSRLTTT